MTQRGFTLVELSIVLVILGLLIGGVLTGQSLIRAAELRSVSTQHARFVTATHTFRDKYMGLPGDLTNAQSYWGVAHATPATCSATASTTALTCNGDGNGLIDSSAGSNERFRFWQHLANAGLIEGSYNGIKSDTAVSSSSNLNSPTGKINSTLWFTVDYGTLSGNANLYDGQYGNSLQFGAFVVDASPGGRILKPEEAYNIDMKTDDGKPATGKIVQFATMTGSATSCTDGVGSAALSANYQLNTSNVICALVFRQQF